ncbi:hypothetical protein J8Z24_05680 [Pseudoalteromonas sp. SCSIO 43201]|uniref:SdrD B-like domain-containing protein n=1 Tax=Pseudoalteromonas sp. SCSIO 43201 TaxID=2822842 RepID=UPI00207656FA|nr:SdrD B-like domain-containing protein [Pseudoalteromonas sp. SCSIO 43201]USD29576.1 hypothetical protein J8Z24_05680 [Pseudoalteromonas sp. SCSIO 43201]
MHFGSKLVMALCCIATVTPLQAKQDIDVNAVVRVLSQLESTLSDIKKPVQAAQAELYIPVGEYLFLSTHLNERHYIGELIAIKNEHSFWIELESFVQMIGLAIEINEAGASGWLKDPDNRFAIDLARQVVFVNEQEYSLQTEDIYIDQDQLFIESNRLNEWFGFSHTVDYGRQSLQVQSQFTYPVEAQIARQSRALSREKSDRAILYPRSGSGYQMLSAPVADIQASFRHNQNQNELTYSVLGSHEFAYMKADYYTFGEYDDHFKRNRLTFSRKSEKGELLGIGATEVRVGDITPVNVSSLSTAGFSAGIKLSNRPMSASSAKRSVNITGEIQQGWDVELYQNGVLLAQELDIESGVYDFSDVELQYGENEFEIVKYGPQGQLTRAKQVYQFDPNLSSHSGEYEFSLNKVGQRLLDKQSNSGDNGWRVAGTYRTSITDGLSTYIGAESHMGSDDDTATYSVGSYYNGFRNWLLNIEHEATTEGESKSQISGNTRVLGQALTASISRNTRSNFQGDSVSNNVYQLNLSGRLHNSSFGSLRHRTQFSVNDTAAGRFTQVVNRLNYGLGRWNIGNQLTWRQSLQSEALFGATQISGSHGGTWYRLGADYQINPEADFTDIYATVTHQIDDDIEARVRFAHSLLDDSDSIEFGSNFNFERFSLFSTASYSSEQHWQVAVAGRFSLGYNSLSSSVFSTKNTLSNRGSLVVRVFLDKNNNSVLDGTDELLPDVEVRAVHAYRRAVTDENGVALLTGLTEYRATDIELQSTSLPDPFMIPAHAGKSIVPRAGFIERLDFPIVYSSEVEGKVFKQGKEEVAFTEVALIDEQGEEVATTRTQFDGFYVFTDVKPGNYEVKLDQEITEARNLKSAQKTLVTLPLRGDVVSGVDINVIPKETEQLQVASLGKFNELNFLKVYLQLIKPRLMAIESIQPFYVQDQAHYLLGVAFSSDPKQDLTALCSQVLEQGINCDVKALEVVH